MFQCPQVLHPEYRGSQWQAESFAFQRQKFPWEEVAWEDPVALRESSS